MTDRMSGVPRLYTDESLTEQTEVVLKHTQSHYLLDVLRLKPGDPVRVFNAADGEWLAYIVAARKVASVRIERHVAAAAPPPDIDYVFAPLKHSRLDYVVQKATELGCRRLRPVFTQRTIVSRVNLARMRANVVEAAEQCNLVYIPEVYEPQPLADVLSGWENDREAVFCDEAASVADPLMSLKSLTLPAGVIIGPEGGFTEQERESLRNLPNSTVISLGPRIMRADTAAVVALALVQATMGDWRT